MILNVIISSKKTSCKLKAVTYKNFYDVHVAIHLYLSKSTPNLELVSFAICRRMYKIVGYVGNELCRTKIKTLQHFNHETEVNDTALFL